MRLISYLHIGFICQVEGELKQDNNNDDGYLGKQEDPS
jgi:hypothetical protein